MAKERKNKLITQPVKTIDSGLDRVRKTILSLIVGTDGGETTTTELVSHVEDFQEKVETLGSLLRVVKKHSDAIHDVFVVNRISAKNKKEFSRLLSTKVSHVENILLGDMQISRLLALSLPEERDEFFSYLMELTDHTQSAKNDWTTFLDYRHIDLYSCSQMLRREIIAPSDLANIFEYVSKPDLLRCLVADLEDKESVKDALAFLLDGGFYAPVFYLNRFCDESDGLIDETGIKCLANYLKNTPDGAEKIIGILHSNDSGLRIGDRYKQIDELIQFNPEIVSSKAESMPTDEMETTSSVEADNVVCVKLSKYAEIEKDFGMSQ